MCRPKGILLWIEKHRIFFKYAIGQGTNNNVEFYAFWLQLKITLEREISKTIESRGFQDYYRDNLLLIQIMHIIA
jgi:hypothetical protein